MLLNFLTLQFNKEYENTAIISMVGYAWIKGPFGQVKIEKQSQWHGKNHIWLNISDLFDASIH